MRGELGQQSFGGVQFGCVRGGVHDGHDRVEPCARDVVRVPVAGAVCRVVVGREDQPGAYRVARVVHREDRRAGRGGEPDLDVGAVLQGGAQAQGCVHQLLEAEDQHAARPVVQRVGDPVGHGGERRFQPGAVRGGEAVPAAVGHTGGPPEVHPGARAGGAGCRSRCRPRPPLILLRYLLRRDQPLPLLQDAVREADRAGVPRHQVDAGADLRGEVGQSPVVGRRAHVDQGHDDVAVAGVALVQGADGVENGVAGGELVIDEHEYRVGRVRLPRVPHVARATHVARITCVARIMCVTCVMCVTRAAGIPRAADVPRQQVRVLRKQQVRGGVRVRLLEAARPRHALDGASRRVEVRCGAEPVGDRVTEAGGRLRVAEHDRSPRPCLPEQLPHPAAQLESGTVDHRGVLRHMLAEHLGHEQMCSLGVAPQGEAQQLTQFAVAHELDAQPLRDPATRPHHVRRLFRRRAPAHRVALGVTPIRKPSPGGRHQNAVTGNTAT